MDPFEYWRPYIVAARANLTTLKFPDDISPDWIRRRLEEMRCSPNYPRIVAHTLMVSRELCTAGCLFFEFFTTSAQYSASALEAALKAKFAEALPVPCRLTRKMKDGTVEETVWSTPPTVDALLNTGRDRWRLPEPFSGFRPTLGYLLSWGVARGLVPAAREQWFQHRVRIRNAIAHGHNMVVAPSWALGTLQQSTLTLNALYPDPETTAHDDKMRVEREARADEWWRDIDGMLRSSNGDADAGLVEGDDIDADS